VTDCILIGSYDLDFDLVYRSAMPTQSRSALISYLQHNSVNSNGRRLTYSGLLNASIADATGRDPALHVGRLPNLASCYLSSFLGKRGISSEIVNSLPHDVEQLRDALAEGAHAVALSTTLYLDPRPVIETVKLVRSMAPSVPIVVGGPYIHNLCRNSDTLTQSLLFRQMGADAYVVEPQGEATLSRIVERYRRRTADLGGIGNTVWRAPDGRWMREPRDPEDNDLDANSIDWSRFSPAYLGPTVQTRTARSCAFKCSFCSHPEMAGPLKLAAIETVETEIERMVDKGARNVVFIDDTFNVPLPRFKKLCRALIQRRFPIRWFSYFRSGNADEEAFDLMAEAGCAGVFLGVESGDPSVLRHMDKFAKVEAQARGIRALNERGIITFASFIVGFPGETEDTIMNTRAFIESTRPTFYRAEVWYADPTTPVMRDPSKFGIRGAAFSWEHETMDWTTAARWVHRLYESVESSCVLPVYGFDFWSLPYLLGNGIELDYVKQFTTIAKKLMLASMAPDGQADPADYAELVELARRRAGPPPVHAQTMS
jgi:radical SAM PhpK family P-methyltransferase